MARKAAPWYKDVAELMLRDRLSFRAAVVQLQLSITNEEIAKIENSSAFRKVLDAEQQLLYQELAANPNFNKNAVVGGMLHAIQQLLKEGEWDKAVMGFMNLAKLQGWLGVENNFNIMLGVSQKDIEMAKEQLKQKAATIQ